MSDLPPCRVRGPKDLPDLRLYMLHNWEPGNYYCWFATQIAAHTNKLHGMSSDPGHYAHWERRHLKQAALLWVSTHMVDVILAAMPSIPEDVLLSDLMPFAPSGLVLLESPLLSSDTFDGKEIEVDAMVWGTSFMRPAPGLGRHQSSKAMSMSFYARSREETVYRLRRVVWEDDCWIPLGRSDWPLGDELGQGLFPQQDSTARASFQEDRRFLATLWTLLAQNALAETVIVPADRPARRRTERAGLSKESSTVKLVRLRQLEKSASSEDTETAHREWKNRWIVEGHWRKQPYGPGRQQRRLTYICPYVKGPEDKPLKAKTKVNVWVR